MRAWDRSIAQNTNFVFVFKNGEGPHVNMFELGQYGRYRTNIWEYAA
jgi:hypothetical protein